MRIPLLLLLCTCTLYSRAQSFGPGNIVVVRIGAGTGPMTAGMAQPVFLDEFTPCGEKLRSIALPVAAAGSQRRLTLPPLAADFTEGFISRSEDGQYLALAGYDAPTGTAGVTATTSTSVNRTIAVIDASGSVNSTTALNNRFSTVVVRGAVVDGNQVWVTGGNGGIVHTTLGNTGTANTLVTTTTGRCLGIYDGQLYASSTATGLRMARAGSGLPATTGQVMTNLPGYPASGGSPLQFFMTRLAGSDTVNVLYLADNGVLKKYSLVAGAWTDNGTIGLSGDKFRGVTGVEEDDIVTLYTVRRNDQGGELIRYVDSTGHNGNFSSVKPLLIAQANSHTVFRSAAMAPVVVTPVARKVVNTGALEFRTLAGGPAAAALAELVTAEPVRGLLQVRDLNGRLLFSRQVNALQGQHRYALLLPPTMRGIFVASFLTLQGQLLTSKFIY